MARSEFLLLLHLLFVPLSCSGVEQPDLVLSAEQTRCVRPHEAELCTPAVAPEDCVTSGIADPEIAAVGVSSQAEDVDLNPSSAAVLVFKLKEESEEVLQLAPEVVNPIGPLTGGETLHTFIFDFIYIYIYTV